MNVNKKTRYLTIMAIIFLIIPSVVFADGVNKFYINATLLDNGDLEVEEIFDLNGYYNGMNRTYNYKNPLLNKLNPNDSELRGSTIHNGDGVNVELVKSLDSDVYDFNSEGYTFELVSSAEKGDYGVYTEKTTSNGKDILIYNPSNYNNNFYVKYIISNFAVKHNDVGEIWWNIFNNEFKEKIGELKVTLNVPNNNSEIKVWGHGPLNGRTEIENNKQIILYISDLNANTAIDIRSVFSIDAIKNSKKTSNINALDKIIKYETRLANEANELREKEIKNAEESLESSFNNLEKTNSKSNYNIVNNNIENLSNIYKKNNIDNDNVISEKYQKLEAYRNKVDIYEYNEFKKNIKGSVNYYTYEIIKYKYLNVFDIELQNKMKQEINSYKRKCMKIEFINELPQIILSLLTILMVYIIIHFDQIKSKKIKNVNPLYQREIPKDISPEEVGLLLNKKMGKNELSASILNLIRRKIIKCEKTADGDNILSLIKDKNELNEIDKRSIELLFGNKEIINIKNNKKISPMLYKLWENKVIDKSEKSNYIADYSKKNKPINGNLLIAGIVLLFTPGFPIAIMCLIMYFCKKYKKYFYIIIFYIINIVLCYSNISINNLMHVGAYTSVLSIIVIYIMLKKLQIPLSIKLTNEGKEKKKELYGLRNFLLNFSRLNEKEIPEVNLWEEYLVYATAFGIGDRVLKAMNVKLTNVNLEETVFDIDKFNNIYLYTTINSKRAISSTNPKIVFPSSSSSGGSSFDNWSSSGGSGGGFSGGSSGGGSGGGGSGGGRF